MVSITLQYMGPEMVQVWSAEKSIPGMYVDSDDRRHAGANDVSPYVDRTVEHDFNRPNPSITAKPIFVFWNLRLANQSGRQDVSY